MQEHGRFAKKFETPALRYRYRSQYKLNKDNDLYRRFQMSETTDFRVVGKWLGQILKT